MDSAVVSGGRPQGRRSLLRSVWTRAALAIAIAEAVLVLVGVIPKWTVVVAAVVVLAAYFLRGRRVSSPALRQGLWAVAVSQAIVLFVPIALWIATAIVIVGLAVAAAIVLAALLLDR